VEEIRRKVFVTAKSVEHPSAIEDPDAFSAYGVDNSFSMEKFKKEFKIVVHENTPERVQFDLIGVDAAIANALRRAMIAEVPSMAIERVRIFQNTSVMQDEVLAHRLGLIPIKADPRWFKDLSENKGVPNEENTLVFTLEVKCERIPNVPPTAPPEDHFKNSKVTSGMLKWIPQGSQAERFPPGSIGVVHDDIPIVHLRPGQEIEAELFVHKGIGKTHAKWSPVATATYRLMPDISFPEPITGDLAKELVDRCPMKVFDIEDLADGTQQARVANPRACTMCRECVRDEWGQRVQLRRIRDHFLFSVESTGAGPPTAMEVVKEALKVLREKTLNILKAMEAITEGAAKQDAEAEDDDGPADMDEEGDEE